MVPTEASVRSIVADSGLALIGARKLHSLLVEHLFKLIRHKVKFDIGDIFVEI